jgi:hypothetical protein
MNGKLRWTTDLLNYAAASGNFKCEMGDQANLPTPAQPADFAAAAKEKPPAGLESPAGGGGAKVAEVL